jgi:hypothetical protein
VRAGQKVERSARDVARIILVCIAVLAGVVALVVTLAPFVGWTIALPQAGSNILISLLESPIATGGLALLLAAAVLWAWWPSDNTR